MWSRSVVLTAVMALMFFAPMVRAYAQLDEGNYKLQVGDRLAVSVYGQPDLSAEGIIDDFGKLALPLLGPTPLSGLTLSEAADQITRRYEGGFLKKALVNVRIGALRPTYVLGDVRQPGAFPFTYGNTVRSLIALAGGYGSAGATKNPNPAEFLSAEERVRIFRSATTTLQLRRARLEAHLKGQDSFVPPAQDPREQLDPALFQQLASSEAEKFASDSKLLTDQIRLIQSQRPRLQSEIDAVSGQIEVGRRELEMLRAQVEQYSAMVKQGLGRATVELDLKMGQTRQEADVWRAVSQLSRLQMDMGELDLRLSQVAADQTRLWSGELGIIRKRIVEVELLLPIARSVRDLQREALAGSALPALRKITISRVVSGRSQTTRASEGDVLLPGDVVEVQLILPAAGASEAEPSAASN